METVSELLIAGRVEGQWIPFAVAGLVGEGEPVRDVVARSFDVLRAEALTGSGDEESHFPGYGLDRRIVGRIHRETGRTKKPSDS